MFSMSRNLKLYLSSELNHDLSFCRISTFLQGIHSLQNFKNESVNLLHASSTAQLSLTIKFQLYDPIN